jgi:hypothetical protein
MSTNITTRISAVSVNRLWHMCLRKPLCKTGHFTENKRNTNRLRSGGGQYDEPV